MSYIDLRIHREDAGAAVQALLNLDLSVVIIVDGDPPAAGPEAEISIGGGFSQPYILEELRKCGVSVLASRPRAWLRNPA